MTSSFQGSAQRIPFKTRPAQDNTSIIQQKAKDAVNNANQRVLNQKNQGIQQYNDFQRRAGIQAQNDALELSQLKDFSSTILDAIDTINKTVVKDHIETKRFEGIQEARNPSPETLEKLAFDKKQLQEIEDRIAKQRQLSLEAGKVFDKNHEKYYRESVEGEIRRRNVSV